MMESQRGMDGSGGSGSDEFIQALYRGGELLTEGKVIEAKEYLERAITLRPENERCQNLLGLTYFKLGVFEKAAEVYGGLVKANPADPTLRVNLGLVHLKTNLLARAIREFETAIDLAPDHAKAHNYLGLALAQSGDYARAREHFLAAGSQQMAERMTRAMASGYGAEISEMPSASYSPVVNGPGSEQPTIMPDEATQSFYAGPRSTDDAQPAAPAAQETDWSSQLGEMSQEMPAAPEMIAPHYPVEQMQPIEPNPVQNGYQLSAPVETFAAPTTVLRTLTPTIQILREPPSGSFQVEQSGVTMWVNGQLLTRLTGLVASCGSLAFSPERKRFRDRTTDRWFGEGAFRMARVQGQGALYFRTEGRIFLPLELDGESAYFREDRVFALENTLAFENGRLPAPFTTDFDLVHLRGSGLVLLGLDADMHSLEISEMRPAIIPLERLVGWQGRLTPRLSALLPDDQGKVHQVGLELTGDGFGLLTLPTS
jgi:Tetratricopeptide repeat